MSPKKQKELRWLLAAQDDLEQIVEYIAKKAPQAAANFAETC